MGAEEISQQNDLLSGTLDMLILGTLRIGPMHGYGIAQLIQQRSEDVFRVGEGSLYPALQRMRVQGWIEAEWGLSENNRRARFYRLTAAGKKQLRHKAADFNRTVEGITSVMQPI